MLKYDSLRPAIKDEIAHLDKQIIIKKVYIVFTNYKNEWKEHKFWTQKNQRKCSLQKIKKYSR